MTQQHDDLLFRGDVADLETSPVTFPQVLPSKFLAHTRPSRTEETPTLFRCFSAHKKINKLALADG